MPRLSTFSGHGAADDSFAKIPLLDKVTAGKLKSSSSQIPVEDVPLLAFADLGRGDFFALTVEGDSDGPAIAGRIGHHRQPS